MVLKHCRAELSEPVVHIPETLNCVMSPINSCPREGTFSKDMGGTGQNRISNR